MPEICHDGVSVNVYAGIDTIFFKILPSGKAFRIPYNVLREKTIKRITSGRSIYLQYNYTWLLNRPFIKELPSFFQDRIVLVIGGIFEGKKML